MKLKISGIFHKLIYKLCRRLIPKKYNRKFFMWGYGLCEEDMYNDITYWNCRD